ncbi:chemotaxis protein CheF1 [Haloplanus rallus]|jgi:helix-turn-helix protein|uniref:Taxis protein CheF n=1 Tax=Haloplanus rallus TaxID=1816183 RepID=A0A6B9FFG4_9EURY|nr:MULTISPECIES: CheF family chemotaxis protein [Haloplanus]QGX94493.1 chemotaxis protein CheF1 [Haloplanus rallus]
MSEGERKIVDTRGKFTMVVKDGRELNDAEWTGGRILLSNKRLILARSDGKRTIPLKQIRSLEGRNDVNQLVAKVSGYVSLQLSTGDVLLVSAEDPESFERMLYRALLDRTVVLARHPAVEGGVVTDVEWEKARLKIGEGSVDIAIADGSFVEIDLDDIGSMEANERSVKGEDRRVLEVEHSQEGTSVQTYISGTTRRCSILETLLRKGESRSEIGVDLTERQNEVLMALYSGVSPFEIPDFLGMDVDEVEEVFDRLIELEVIEEIRTRREVALNARGRNIASEAMNDQ